MKLLEALFEGILWRSRYVVVFAVIASMAATIGIFYMVTADVVYMIEHLVHYTSPELSAEARQVLHAETITHIVEVVDGYLLATVMLIFSLGLYELFISEIDEAKGEARSSRILFIESLDDLKTRLGKVILMILIVTLFQEAIKVKIETPLDLLYLGASIALVGAALFLSHAADGKNTH